MSVEPTASGKWRVRWREGGRNRAKTFEQQWEAEHLDIQLARKRSVARLPVQAPVDSRPAVTTKRGWRGIAAVLPVLAAATSAQPAAAHTTRPDLQVSLSPDRSGSVPLQGFSTADRNLYFFARLPSTAGVSHVDFHLDEQRDSSPRRRESTAPYDFMGGATSDPRSPANPWNPTLGGHSIGAFVRWSDGHTTSDTDSFTVTATPSPAAFDLGVTDRRWLANDQATQASLGYRRTRTEGGIAGHAAHYDAKGVAVVDVVANSTGWASLRDDWLNYGPNGAVVPGVVDRLEVGNEEAYSYRTSDPYGAGRIHGAAVRSLKAAVPSARIVCQGDDGARGTDAFFRGMRDANSQIAADCAEYALHPYGPSYAARTDRARAYIDSALGDPGAPLAITEWGLSVRLDQGCVSDNYGWGTCMSHAEAATRVRDFVAHMKARGDVRMVVLYQNTDQTTDAWGREYNFGLLSSSATGYRDKGAYTAEARSLITANAGP